MAIIGAHGWAQPAADNVGAENLKCLDLVTDLGNVGIGCVAHAESANVKVFESGIAYYNAARAYNYRKDYLTAADVAKKSFDRLSDDELMRLDSPMKKRRDNKRWISERPDFRFSRVMEYATAFNGLAEPYNTNAAQLCVDKYDCLSRAIDKLADNAVVQPYAETSAQPRDPRYNSFHFLRGSMHAMRNNPTDVDRSIADFKTILAGSLSYQKGAAAAALEEVAYKAGADTLERGRQTGVSLDRAIEYFNNAIQGNPESGRAYKGMGDVYWLYCANEDYGISQRIQSCRSAKEAFDAASLRTSGSEQAEAYLGLGQSLEIWANLLAKSPTPNPNVVAAYRQESINAYERASLTATGDTRALLSLAQAYERAGRWDDASAAYRSIIGLKIAYPDWIGAQWKTPVNADLFREKIMPLDSAGKRDVASALLALASARTKAETRVRPVELSILNAAQTTLPNLVQPPLQMGAYFYDNKDWANARDAFMRVLQLTGGTNGPASAGLEDEKAEAFYQLSRIEASQAGLGNPFARTTTNGVNYAKTAYTLRGSEHRYQENACLAHTVLGGTSVTDSASSSWCAGLTGPQGQLLLGMFYLRRAQISPRSQQLGLRDVAQFAFSQGLNALPASTGSGKDPAFDVEWPGAPQQAIPLRVALEFGRAKSIACSGSTTQAELSLGEINIADSFYNFFKVGSCAP